MRAYMSPNRGFTLIELLVVAAIIGILLAIAIPNLLKARISANEVNARKSMQTLRDAEGMFFEQDLDGDGSLNYTNLIGDNSTPGSLRCPSSGCIEEDSLIDTSFEGARAPTIDVAECPRPKAGYCIQFDPTVTSFLYDFGWQTSMTSFRTNGRRDFSIYGDRAIRCSISTSSTGTSGTFQANKDSSAGCD